MTCEHGIPPAAARVLTEREWQVAELVGQGLTEAEIAGALRLSRRTVHEHTTFAMARTGHHTRLRLALWVNGVLPLASPGPDRLGQSVSPRQRQAIEELAQHGQPDAAAACMGITIGTHRKYIRAALARTGASSPIQAAWYIGLLTLSEHSPLPGARTDERSLPRRGVSPTATTRSGSPRAEDVA